MASMCPSAPVSPLRDIDINDNDEEMVMHLRKFINGAPLPPNVLDYLNPRNAVPWYLPENMLYYINAEDHMSLNHGYWKATGQDRIIVATPAEGRRTTLEFYRGQAPDGEKTDWVMHEYRVDQRPQNYSLLCRVFRNVGGGSIHEEYHGDIIDKMLLQFDDQEANSNSQDSTNRPQMMTGIEQGQMSDETYDYISRGEYLELDDLNDLVGYESSFSTSENSSMNSDECFDSAALLRDIENANNPNTKEQHVDHKFNVAAPRGPNQVVIQPPPSGSICNTTSNTRSAVSMTGNVSLLSPALPASTVKPQPSNRTVPRSVPGTQGPLIGPSTSQGSICNTTSNTSSAVSMTGNVSLLSHALPASTVKPQPSNRTVPRSVPGTQGPLIGPSTSQGGAIQTGSKSSWISKIGKKYCCFIPI
ncbi:uncharacterized protein LOC143875553 isoform X2 [Tasmannia lanceolata]|uniref:uncharacterized protein LOC143875553 isoform X2 n=1 Tax=Tasmannia lanceolata TaxID=3420 RepID=UPI004062C53F